MEAKEILAKYKDQIIIHSQIDTGRATRPLQSVETINRPSDTSVMERTDDMSRIGVCGVLNLNPKELTVRQEENLDYIISEVKRLGNEYPEKAILHLVARIGEPPLGTDIISHLTTYLKIRTSAEELTGQISV